MIVEILDAIKREGSAGHPNREMFRGMLALIDRPSDNVPAGARNHRIHLKREAAEMAIHTLLGMAVDCKDDFSGHDTRRKVGIITKAEVIGPRIEFQGYLFARDFPELVTHLLLGRSGDLGCSFELADAIIVDRKAEIWVIERCIFTGAAIMKRDKAAYRDTWVELT